MNVWIEQLWRMSIQAGILTIAVLFLRFLFRSYPKRYSYYLWMLVLFRLLCPIFIESNYSLQPNFTVADAENVPPKIPQKLPAQVQQPLENFMEKEGEASANQTTRKDSKPAFSINLQLLYLAGCMIFTVFTMMQYLRLKKQIRYAVRENGNIWRSEGILSPFVMGIRKPRIYLPYQVTDEEKVYILLHERAHIAHGDCLIRMLETVAWILHWWNPLIWYAIYKMNQDMEMFCDETALANAPVGERKAYSKILLHFSMKQNNFAPTLSFGESNTEMRIKNVLRRKKKSVWAVVVLFLLAGICALVFLTSPNQPDLEEVITASESQDKANQEELPMNPDTQEAVTEALTSETSMQETEQAAVQVQQDYYKAATTFEASKVEAFAEEVRSLVLAHDWNKLSEKISYPLTIAGNSCQNAKEFLALDMESLVTEDFLTGIEDEDCKEMFHNWQGIMMGETGQIWLAEVMDNVSGKGTLKLIALNLPMPQNTSDAKHPWYDAYAAILKDWKQIETLGDFSYLDLYFGEEYYFDNYWLCDVDKNGIPELFLHSDFMMLTAVFTYADDTVQYLTYNNWYGINPETSELIVFGHWHGAGGSGDNEWTVYEINGREALFTGYIDIMDTGSEKRYTVYEPLKSEEYNTNASKEAYDALFETHVKPCILISNYKRYALNDLEGLGSIQ